MEPDQIYDKLPVEFNAATVLLDDHIKSGKGDKVAVYYCDDTYTYKQLLDRSNQAANALSDLGLEIENRFLILLHDCPDFITSFLGGMRIGAVPVPVNSLLSAEDYRFMLNDSRAKVLVTNAALYDKIKPIRSELNGLRHIVIVPREGDDLSWTRSLDDVHDLNELIDKADKNFQVAKTYKNDVGLWLYSSGSTGKPKGTVHLQHDIMVTTDLYAKNILGIDSDSICFSASKLFFAYGLGNGLTFPLRWGGASVLYPDKPTPKGMFECIEKYKPTHFFGVPTLFAAMLAVDGAEKYDLSSVKAIVSAGEALQPALFNKWKETFGQEIVEGIGSTELLHIFIANKPGDVKAGATGKIVPGYEARVVDTDYNDVPIGEVGNLIVKGESMAPFYWGRHKKSAHTMVGEWMWTGDMYRRDEQGWFYYAGRSDDMLKVGGIWVSPAEVEGAIMEMDEVLECAVVGHPDEEKLIKPKAFVVLKQGFEGSDDLKSSIQNHVKTSIGKFKFPRWVDFVDDLPKTATGKIQRFKLRG